jgi:hypothetical protein
MKWNYGTGERVSQLALKPQSSFPILEQLRFANFQNSFVVELIATSRCQKNLASTKIYPSIRGQNLNESNNFPRSSHAPTTPFPPLGLLGRTIATNYRDFEFAYVMRAPWDSWDPRSRAARIGGTTVP